MAMTDTVAQDDVRKASKLPLIIGLVVALAGGAGGFYAVYSGMVLGGDSQPGDVTRDEHSAEVHDDGQAGLDIAPAARPEAVFVPLDPLVISLAPGAGSRHLRFRAQLEVPPEHERAVRSVLPRIIDVLNSYLRAVETRDFEDPTVLGRLRAQMLRRVQIVAGASHVRDLLIMEFVLN